MSGSSGSSHSATDTQKSWTYRFVSLLGMVTAGLVLLGAILQSESLVAPYWLEDVSRAVYKLAFFIILPFRSIVFLFIPRVDHHWTLMHYVVTCMGTP